LLHVSDLHAGKSEEPEVAADLRSLVRETRPALVIATGDLTHRNRPANHERAAALLRSLERPLLVVPGNHDIPPWSPQRFTRTFALPSPPTRLGRGWPGRNRPSSNRTEASSGMI
jgi:3',5'-cyclic AMP phosphodiesterase CpdA